jgi:tetratricopeptide (TPR) repeat protein
VVLSWEKLRLPFQVDVPTNEVVIASLERELYGLGQFFWQPWNDAANWAVAHDTHLDKAAEWVDQSRKINQNFANTRTKARLLAKSGDTKGAEALMAQALPTASEAELNAYGYQLLGEKKNAEAVAIFKSNATKHPESWNVHDSLGEALEAAGKKTEAIASYKKALSLAPEAQKGRIQGIIDRLSK